MPSRRLLRAAALATVLVFLGLVARFWHPVYGFTAFFQLDASNDDLKLAFNYDVGALSKIYSRIGNRGGAISLPGYAIHNASVTLSGADGGWDVTLYVKNLFGKFAETAVAGTPRYNQTVTDDDGGAVYVRTFYTFPVAPRSIGVRFNRQFGW